MNRRIRLLREIRRLMRDWLTGFFWQHSNVIEAVSYVVMALIVALVLLAFLTA